MVDLDAVDKALEESKTPVFNRRLALCTTHRVRLSSSQSPVECRLFCFLGLARLIEGVLRACRKDT